MNSDMISRPVAQLELGFKSHVFDNKRFYIHIYIFTTDSERLKV